MQTCDPNLKRAEVALAAARKRQNPRTGFVHEPVDLIPLYENFCLATALLLEKQVASVLEGKELLLRLLAFQGSEGNFPLYLHEFPKCYDPHQGLKIGALFRQLLDRTQGEVRGVLEAALQKILAQARPRSPLWEFRRDVLAGSATQAPQLETATFSPDEWWEYWVSLQFLQMPVCPFYNPELGAILPLFQGPWPQQGLEPAPHPIEWMLGKSASKDHVRQIQLIALRELGCAPVTEQLVLNTSDALRLLWRGTSLHTLVMPRCGAQSFAHQVGQSIVIDIELAPLAEMTRDDLFEVALFCDASPETALLVEQQRATVFGLNDLVSLVTPTKTLQLRFEQLSGDGEFCGHLFRANRPSQTLSDPHAAYDWKIALRTLRRTGSCRLRLTISWE